MPGSTQPCASPTSSPACSSSTSTTARTRRRNSAPSSRRRPNAGVAWCARPISASGERLWLRVMSDRVCVYLFRSRNFMRGSDAVVSAAPLDLVVSVYGGGGTLNLGGLAAAFGGGAFFRNETTGRCFLGVWGARNASRFRAALRASGAAVSIIREPPPARLIFFETRGNGQSAPSPAMLSDIV